MKRLIWLVFALLSINVYAQDIIQMEKSGGVYKVPCKINGLGLKFIFDTGASDVSLSLSEAVFMVKNGYLNESDFRGTETYRIANGEIAEGTKVILRKVEFGKQTLYDVEASIVHSMDAPLLLGQSVLQRLGKFSFDYNKGILIIGENDNPIDESSIRLKVYNDLTVFNLKGNVKSIKCTYYDVVEKNGKLLNSSENLVQTYLFDQIGNLTESVRFEPSSQIENSIRYYIRTDINGNKTLQEEYNNSNKLISKSIYKYNSLGCLSEETVTNDIGKVLFKFVYYCDKFGNATEEKCFMPLTGGYNGRSINKFDSQGYKLEESRFLADGALSRILTFKYDYRGGCIEENECEYSIFSGDLLSCVVTLREYEYDKFGNWIKLLTKIDGYPPLMAVRSIVYY